MSLSWDRCSGFGWWRQSESQPSWCWCAQCVCPRGCCVCSCCQLQGCLLALPGQMHRGFVVTMSRLKALSGSTMVSIFVFLVWSIGLVNWHHLRKLHEDNDLSFCQSLMYIKRKHSACHIIGTNKYLLSEWLLYNKIEPLIFKNILLVLDWVRFFLTKWSRTETEISR